MTNTYQSPPPGSPPEREPARADEAPSAPESRAVARPPEEAQPESAPPTEADEHAPSTIDAEQERLVWSPPLPQYPPRPTRQQEPVQYQAPRPQPAPNYAPQAYTPPQPAPTAALPAPPQQIPAPPQQSYAPAIPGGYSAPVAPFGTQPQTVIAMPAPRVSKARLTRRMARRMVMGVDGARKAIFGVRPILTFFFIVLVLFTGWLAFDKWLAGSGTSATPNAAGKSAAVSLPPESAMVKAYLNSVQKGDADGVWNTLGAQEKAHRISTGADKTVLSAVLQAEQQNGFSYTGYHYVAAYGTNGSSDPSKGGIYFYVADVGRGTQHTSVPMVFQMDDKGQISDVTDQLYDFVLQQLKGN